MKIAFRIKGTSRRIEFDESSYFEVLKEICNPSGDADSLWLELDSLDNMIKKWDDEGGGLDKDNFEDGEEVNYQNLFRYKDGVNLVLRLDNNSEYQFYKVDNSVLKNKETMSEWVIKNVIVGNNESKSLFVDYFVIDGVDYVEEAKKKRMMRNGSNSDSIHKKRRL